MEALLSERLVLRPIRVDDLSFFVRLHADPRVARTLADGRPRSEEATRQWFSLILASYDAHGVGHLAVCRRADGQLLGRCGLSLCELEAEPATGASDDRPLRCFYPSGAASVTSVRELEIGYVIAAENWGNGYATEAARAVRDEAFRSAKIDSLVSVIFVGNTASERVATKLSMTKRDRAYLLGDRLVSVYQVRRP